MVLFLLYCTSSLFVSEVYAEQIPWTGNNNQSNASQQGQASGELLDIATKVELEGGIISPKEQWQTIFDPRELYRSDRIAIPEEYGCGFGDVLNTKTGEIKKIQEVKPEELNASPSDWRYCTVAPIWFGSSQELLLQKENPTLLLDTEKINGQGFMKGVASFANTSWSMFDDANSDGVGQGLFLPGIFPMDEHVTYRQIPLGQIEYASLEDIRTLLNIVPRLFSVGDFETMLDIPKDTTKKYTIRKLLPLEASQVSKLLIAVPTALITTVVTPNSTYVGNGDILTSLLLYPLSLNPPTYLLDGGAKMVTNTPNLVPTAEGAKLSTSPVMGVAHTGEPDESASKYAVYKDESLLLSPVFRLLSQELENKIRPKADFLCKSSGMYEFSLGEGEHWGSPFLDHSFLFFSDGWKAACASLSGEVYDNKNYHAMVGPFVDQSFNNKKPNGTGGMLAATDVTTTFGSAAFLEAQTEPARTSIGNRDTAHMDWFQSAAHCAARGGRLPRTDEVLAMAIDSAEHPQTSLFFQSFPHVYPHTYMPGTPTTPERYLYHGSFVWTGDFVKGTNSEEWGTRQVPFVNALYVPPSWEGNVSQNPNDRVAFDAYSCDVWGDMTLKRLAARKDNDPFDAHAYIDWNNARLCRVSLDYRVNEAKGHGTNGDGRGYFVASAITDPLAQEYEALTLPSAYPTNSADYHQLSAAVLIPSTHTLCVYD